MKSSEGPDLSALRRALQGAHRGGAHRDNAAAGGTSLTNRGTAGVADLYALTVQAILPDVLAPQGLESARTHVQRDVGVAYAHRQRFVQP